MRDGKAVEALKLIKQENPFPSICGRICPAPCEPACVLTEDNAAIGIRALERYAADLGKEKPLLVKPKVCGGRKIAIIGSGPMGMSAASLLAQKNYQVTLFEAMDQAGGLLRYGIPEFRLTEGVLDDELQSLKMLGVEIKINAFFNRRESIKQLFKDGFSAILLTLGGGRPVLPQIPGVNLGGVYFSQEFLMRVNHFRSEKIMGDPQATKIGMKVAVIGSNHAALDCARTAVRLGREAGVILPYIQEDMKVGAIELAQAMEEGVKIEALTQPLEIIASENNFVKGVRCMHMDFADPESNEQWRLMPVKESEFVYEADTVIISLGQERNAMIEELAGSEGIFIPPQLSNEGNSIVDTIAAGKKIAVQIDEYLKIKK